MFQHSDTHRFQLAPAAVSRGAGPVPVRLSHVDYERAIARGHYLRSRVFHDIAAGLGRTVAGLIGR